MKKKELMQISFSGGLTSAYMTKMLLDNYSDQYDFIVTFANTGMEKEETLKFVDNCDKFFNFNTVWLEADVQHGKRISSKHKIVDFKTASRNGEPFHEVIKKYGIPNKKYPHCTRELKLNAMNSYLDSIGINYREIKTALGIRTDECRRVSKSCDAQNIIYPLIDMFPSDREDVLDFWSTQSFKLGLNDWDGNCKLCFKKSFKKLFKQLDADKSQIYFHMKMERLYPKTGNKKWFDGNRVFFRGNMSSGKLLEFWHLNRCSDSPVVDVQDGGCSESCEIYPMEVI